MTVTGEAQALKASVIVPVKNGGVLLTKILAGVLEQQTSWLFDVLVIDSGSTDGSQQRVRDLGIPLHEIEPAEFGHGKTRNLGASLTAGEFIVYLTHDALPADQYWLQNLIAAAELTPDTAGAFGSHYAYPESGPIIARELTEHFAGFGSEPVSVRMDDPQRYADEESYRQFLHFFSSNNSCLRRSVWQHIPLPDVDFAEDQTWAKSIIEAGYAKAFAPNAGVFHSHSFGVLESYRRAFDEARSYKRCFDYDLVPNFKHLVVHLTRLNWRDIRWIREAKLSRVAKLHWLLKTPFLNLAKMTGYYAGGQQHRLPTWLVEQFSRDKALQKS